MSTATSPATAPAPPVTGHPPPPAGPGPAPPAGPPGGPGAKPDLSEVQKPGYATTEFWMSAFALISTIGVGLFHWDSQRADDWTRITGPLAPILAMVIGFLITRQYVIQRGDVKAQITAMLGSSQLKAWLAPQAQGANRLVPVAAAPPGAGLSGRFTTVGGVVVVVQDGKIVQIGDTVAGQ